MPGTDREHAPRHWPTTRKVCGKGVRLYSLTLASTIALPGDKLNADHALHPQHGIVLAEPHSATAVGMLLNGGVDRHDRWMGGGAAAS